MRGERILHADDTEIARDGFRSGFDAFGSEDEHELIGQAASIKEVQQLMENGLQPTVAIIDKKMPGEYDGEIAAEIIRKLSPKTIIISLSSDKNVTFGDYNLLKNIRSSVLFDFITNLKHK